MTLRLRLFAVLLFSALTARAEEVPSWSDAEPRARKTTGALVEGVYGVDPRGNVFDVRGIHLIAGLYTHRATTFGLEAGVGDERRRVGDDALRETRGMWTRWGGVLGWGGPWNDTVAGFMVGAGAVVAADHGREYPPLPPGGATHAIAILGRNTYDHDQPRTITRWAVRPYLDWSLVLQIPIKRWSVRPIAGMTGMLVYDQDDGLTHLVFASAGLVWKAW